MIRNAVITWSAHLCNGRRQLIGGVAAAACMLPLAWANAQSPGFSGRLLDIDRRFGEGVFWTEVMLNGNGITSANVQSDVTAVVEAADFLGSGAAGGGQFTADLPYPGGTFTPGGDGEDFGVLLEATVTIPAGTYQMAFGSDDAGWINLRGVPFFNRVNDEEPINAAFFGMFNDAVWYDDTRGLGWTGGTFEVSQETTTRFRGFFMENGGGDAFEVAIRDASTFETPDIGNGNLLMRDLDQWVLLEDGALGWSVTTDLDPGAPIVDEVGGRNLIGTALRSGQTQNLMFGPEQLFEGKVFARRFNLPGGRGGQFDSVDVARDFAANNEPTAQGLLDQIIWSSDDFYPQALGFGFARGNAGNYGVLVTGEIFVPSANVQFKDGNDDFTGFVIDLDGDGDLSDEFPVIDDDMWTNMEGQDNGASPISFASFSNLPPEGDWRIFEFYLGESGGGDSAHLAWDQNATLTPFPFADSDPLTQEHTIRSESFRTTAPGDVIGGELHADLVRDFTALNFQVDVNGQEWDAVGVNNPNRNVVSTQLNVDGAEIIIDVVNGTPTDGFTIDIIDDSVDEIVGTPASFAFTFGDPSDWDTSDFLNSGRITFGAAPMMGIDGDYNGNGTVEQADLDLVLLNWGAAFDALPAEWVNQRPTEGIVAQAQLDGVLLNWGDTAALGGAAGVPEPTSVVLLIAAGAMALFSKARRLVMIAFTILATSVLANTAAAQMTPGFTGRLLDVSETLDEHAEALGLSRGVGLTPALIESDIIDLVTVADLGGGNGIFPIGAAAANPYPGGISTPGGGDDFIVTLEAMVTIPAGTWQIAFGTDDGGALQLDGVFFDERFNEEDPVSGSFFGMHSNSLFYDDNRGQGWTSGVFTVDQPTTTRFFHSFHERGGGDVTEIAIRDASLFSVDVIRDQAIDPALDSWVLLEDGALGWEVKTDLNPSAVPINHIAGRGLIGAQRLNGALANEVRGSEELVEGKVLLQRYEGGDVGSNDNLAAFRTYVEGRDPAHEALTDRMMLDDGELYPGELGLGHIGVGGTAGLTVVYSGEMRISNQFVNFKDGNNDYAGLVVDTNGDGVLDYNDPFEVLIDDDTNTDLNGDGNGGSPISFASFTGDLTGENAWRKFEFYFSAEGAGNNAALAWDQNDNPPEAAFFPFIESEPFGPEHIIRPDDLRVRLEPIIGGDAMASLTDLPGTLAFDVDSETGQADSIGISADPAFNAVLDVDGANILIDVKGTPTAGMTVDIVDASVDEIVGTPSFAFTFGDATMWDTSQFGVSGALTFTGGVGAASGIPEPSSLALAAAVAGIALARLTRRRRTLPCAGSSAAG